MEKPAKRVYKGFDIVFKAEHMRFCAIIDGKTKSFASVDSAEMAITKHLDSVQVTPVKFMKVNIVTWKNISAEIDVLQLVKREKFRERANIRYEYVVQRMEPVRNVNRPKGEEFRISRWDALYKLKDRAKVEALVETIVEHKKKVGEAEAALQKLSTRIEPLLEEATKTKSV